MQHNVAVYCISSAKLSERSKHTISNGDLENVGLRLVNLAGIYLGSIICEAALALGEVRISRIVDVALPS